MHRLGHYQFPPQGIPKLLIDSGIDINAKNNDGQSPLEISLLSGRLYILVRMV